MTTGDEVEVCFSSQIIRYRVYLGFQWSPLRASGGAGARFSWDAFEMRSHRTTAGLTGLAERSRHEEVAVLLSVALSSAWHVCND